MLDADADNEAHAGSDTSLSDSFLDSISQSELSKRRRPKRKRGLFLRPFSPSPDTDDSILRLGTTEGGLPKKKRPDRSEKRRNFYLSLHDSNPPLTILRQAKEGLERAEIRALQDKVFVKPSLYKTGLFEEQKREILVPEETIAVLAGVSADFAGAENIWYEQVRHGCRVHVLPATESVGKKRKVVLWGSPRATELVASNILKTQERQEQGDPLIGIRKPPVPIFPSRQALSRVNRPTPLIRGVWSHVSRPPANYYVVISRLNSVSTVRDFAECVEQLTTCLPAENFRGPHNQGKARALRALFDDHSKEHLFSTAALNVAISYLLKENYLNEVLSLFNRGRHVATTGTFNILLKSLARRQNIIFFPSVVKVMARTGIRPDINTWLAYIKCIAWPKARRDMVKELRKKGYLQTTSAMRAMLQAMVQELFDAHLQRGKSVDKFFYKTIMPAGFNWFPQSLLKQMFTVTSNRADEAAMKRLLELSEENNLSLPSLVIPDIIHFFPKDTFSAIYYALRVLDKFQVVFDQLTYQKLFQNAFNNKHYNICRVLWRYACMDKAVSKPMRDSMTFLLLQNSAEGVATHQDRVWCTCAAKVIAGVSLHLPDYPLRSKFLEFFPSESHNNPVAALMTSLWVEGGERARQRDMARAIVKHDHQIGAWYRPKYSLAHMLEAAAELDREWGDIPRPASWLLRNAIQIPVELVGSI